MRVVIKFADDMCLRARMCLSRQDIDDVISHVKWPVFMLDLTGVSANVGPMWSV